MVTVYINNITLRGLEPKCNIPRKMRCSLHQQNATYHMTFTVNMQNCEEIVFLAKVLSIGIMLGDVVIQCDNLTAIPGLVTRTHVVVVVIATYGEC